jgi:hypothetical protein
MVTHPPQVDILQAAAEEVSWREADVASISDDNDDSYEPDDQQLPQRLGSGMRPQLQGAFVPFGKQRCRWCDDTGGNYSRGVWSSVGDDETGNLGGGVHGSRGMRSMSSHLGYSSGGGMSGGNQSLGSYASTDNNGD